MTIQQIRDGVISARFYIRALRSCRRDRVILTTELPSFLSFFSLFFLSQCRQCNNVVWTSWSRVHCRGTGCAAHALCHARPRFTLGWSLQRRASGWRACRPRRIPSRRGWSRSPGAGKRASIGRAARQQSQWGGKCLGTPNPPHFRPPRRVIPPRTRGRTKIHGVHEENPEGCKKIREICLFIRGTLVIKHLLGEVCYRNVGIIPCFLRPEISFVYNLFTGTRTEYAEEVEDSVSTGRRWSFNSSFRSGMTLL